MRTNNIVSSQLILLLLVVFFTTHRTALAQLDLNKDRISEAQWSQGFHGFNMIAQGNGLERITLQQFNAAEPGEVLLIVIGRLKGLPVNVSDHVRRGGAALVASDSNLPYSAVSFGGFRFGKINPFPKRDREAFGQMPDCPIIQEFGDHPIVSDIRAIVTNRPGYVIANFDSNLAWLPPHYLRRNGDVAAFVAANETDNGGRMVAIGDQSIFANQMLIYGDNARFANQTIRWLHSDVRKKLLILVDGSQYSSLDPADVALDLPPPTKEEVLNALTDLPPSAMLEFANSVATVVEDENMINEFIQDSMSEVPPAAMDRFNIFLMFGIACLCMIMSFIFQRKLQRQTASEVAVGNANQQQNDLKKIQFHERQQAALFLLDKFCIDIAGKRLGHWPSFPTELNFGKDHDSKSIFESMRKMSILYKSKPTDFWTRKKLATLQGEVNRWRVYFDSRPAFSDEAREGLMNRNTL